MIKEFWEALKWGFKKDPDQAWADVFFVLAFLVVTILLIYNC